MLTLKNLVDALSKVNSIAGDIPVVLNQLEGDAETEVKHFELQLAADGTPNGGKVILRHGPLSAIAAAVADPSTAPDSTGA